MDCFKGDEKGLNRRQGKKSSGDTSKQQKPFNSWQTSLFFEQTLVKGFTFTMFPSKMTYRCDLRCMCDSYVNILLLDSETWEVGLSSAFVNVEQDTVLCFLCLVFYPLDLDTNTLCC